MPDDAPGQHVFPAALPGRNIAGCLTHMQLSDLDFELPPELIAQTPAPQRAASRLLHYRRGDRSIAHRQFSDLPALLHPGDVLVFNDSRVLPARFTLRKTTGGRVEGLFLREESRGLWRVLLRDIAGLASGAKLSFSDDPAVVVTLLERVGEGECRVSIESDDPPERLLARLGRMPLPPYIRRAKDHDDLDDLDRQRYQTVYAHHTGSVAAPTAGLHFTPAIFDQLDAKGVERVFVTLHVGMGTFKPITAERIEDHAMHTEHYTLPAETCERINRAKRDGRRVIAVGTTAARVLESQPAGEMSPTTGDTSIFIRPPYQWKHVGALLTNFHLPRSTLIALVAAFVGLEEQKRMYAAAIAERYRFFSYGDASLLE
jgi:S-adenosylmethionine:tRNA ribosyltransferase-isomerase